MMRGGVERRADGLRIEIPANRDSGFLTFLAGSAAESRQLVGLIAAEIGVKPPAPGPERPGSY